MAKPTNEAKGCHEFRGGPMVGFADSTHPARYRRTAYSLHVLTLRDAAGTRQTLRVTPEHPFSVQFAGWTAAKSLRAGDTLLGVAGTLTVIANDFEPRPQGVTVFNLEVEGAHTYFVRAENAQGEPVWVHNAEYIRGQNIAPHPEGWVGSRYQRHVVGHMQEQQILLANGRRVRPDDFQDWIVEAKFAGGTSAGWRRSIYNPLNPQYVGDDSIIDQADRLLTLYRESGVRGVRYAIGSAEGADHIRRVLENRFSSYMRSGVLQIWQVPINLMP